MISIAGGAKWKIGDTVNVRNYSRGSKWVPGIIIQETGPLPSRVELEDGAVVRRHHDQLVSVMQMFFPLVWQFRVRAPSSNKVSFRRLLYLGRLRVTHYVGRSGHRPYHPGEAIPSERSETPTALLLMDPFPPP